MFSLSAEILVLKELTPDGRQLFLTRFVRLFAYGFLSVVLTLYLAELGFSNKGVFAENRQYVHFRMEQIKLARSISITTKVEYLAKSKTIWA